MLLFVLHLLGDLLEIGSRSCELRRLSVLQQDFQGPQRVLFLRASSALQTLCIGQVIAHIFYPDGAFEVVVLIIARSHLEYQAANLTKEFALHEVDVVIATVKSSAVDED